MRKEQRGRRRALGPRRATPHVDARWRDDRRHLQGVGLAPAALGGRGLDGHRQRRRDARGSGRRGRDHPARLPQRRRRVHDRRPPRAPQGRARDALRHRSRQPWLLRPRAGQDRRDPLGQRPRAARDLRGGGRRESLSPAQARDRVAAQARRGGPPAGRRCHRRARSSRALAAKIPGRARAPLHRGP